MGATFINTTQARTGRDSVAVARGFLIAREVFDLPELWREIDSLHNKVHAEVQTRLLLAIRLITDQAVRSGSRFSKSRLNPRVQGRRPRFNGECGNLLPQAEQQIFRVVAPHMWRTAPPALAERVVVLNTLSTAMDIVQIQQRVRPGSRRGRAGLLLCRRILWPVDGPPPGSCDAGGNPLAVARRRCAN